MASPIPHVPLKDQCAVIDNNTLYVYSPYAFQALPLKKKAKWQTLSYGVPVKGATCVTGVAADGDTMLFVVGGTPARKSPNYTGLQAYSFSKKRWTLISPQVPVTQNLQGHGTAFLNNSGSILIYGGSQKSATLPSTQSFTVSVNPPFSVQAYSCSDVPALSPLVLPWDSSSAITVGGSPDNTEIYKFDPVAGWGQYPTTLTKGLKPPQQEQALLIQGADGSRVLELYDLSVTPNTVSHIVLQNANGLPVLPGETAGTGQTGIPNQKRGLTLKSWPLYNATNAPNVSRTGFSLARSPDGMVVIAGGNAQYPLELFNEDQNMWINPSKFFATPKHHAQKVLKHKHTTNSHSSSAAPSSSPTSTGAAGLDTNHPQTSLILGATLGAILGFIAILIIILLILRHRRRRRRPDHLGERDDEKQRLSFADRGASFMKEAGGAINRPQMVGHDSMVLLGNKEYSPGPNHRRSETRGSDSSTARLVPKSRGGMADAMELETIGEKSSRNSPQTQSGKSNFLDAKPKRSSGWSRYFSGTDMPSIGGSGRNSNNSGRAASRSSKTTSSHDCNSHGPTEIPPLNLGQQFTSQRVSRVVTGNGQPVEDFAVGVERSDTQRSTVPSSRRMRPRTMSSTLSSNPPSTITDTVFTHDVHDESNSWTPVTRSDWTAGRRRDTTTSSIYESSNAPSDAVPQTPRIVEPPAAAAQRASSAVLWPRSSNRSSDRTSYYDAAPQKSSATTALPIPAGTAMVTAVAARKPSAQPVQSDMSWVNLGPLASR